MCAKERAEREESETIGEGFERGKRTCLYFIFCLSFEAPVSHSCVPHLFRLKGCLMTAAIGTRVKTSKANVDTFQVSQAPLSHNK